LKADPVKWLLEENNPSVRCLTLTGTLGLPDRRKARQKISEIGAATNRFFYHRTHAKVLLLSHYLTKGGCHVCKQPRRIARRLAGCIRLFVEPAGIEFAKS
jgi:hypothetical protein